jgi:hypothetical protein
MQALEIPRAADAVRQLAGIIAPESNVKGKDYRVGLRAGIADHRIKKIRLGILQARENEYRALIHALIEEVQGLEKRSAERQAELRRIAEILEPRRAGGGGGDTGGKGG